MKRYQFLISLVAPLSILSSVLFGDVVTIPVQMDTIPIGGTDTKIAYGIYVKVGDGGEQRLFQLDSGNGGFLAGYSDTAVGSNQFWGSVSSINGAVTQSAGFGSGIDFTTIIPVSASVTLSNAGGSNLYTIPGITVGQVTQAQGGDLPTDQTWANDLANGQAPLHQTYYGNFGAGLFSDSASDIAESSQFFSALGMIENIKGFSIYLGGSTPWLRLIFKDTAGESYTMGFANATLMQGGDGRFFPVTGYSVHSEFPFDTSSMNVGGTNLEGGNGVMDTGGVNFALNSNNQTTLSNADLLNGSAVKPNNEFSILVDGAGTVDGVDYGDFSLGFLTGNTSSIDKLELADKTTDLNFGPALYNYYEIMYDLEDGVIRFRTVPEPQAIFLAILVFAFALIRLFRRSSRD